ncbi:MAG: divergent polysaccharide deacetylase family protein [Hyphomicrobiales bacterium]|nr:divergent polysaccharide deacetylase family protein [Hyphomicrobiales bacterium]
MANDLDAPLGLTHSKRPFWMRIPFGIVGLAMVGLVGAVLGVWLVFMRDPTGGEPQAVVKLDRSKTGLAKTDVAVAEPRAAAEPEATDRPAQQGLVEVQPVPGGGLEPAPPHRVPETAEGRQLSTQPIARVSEKTHWGLLPRIASDGARPLDVYARPTPRLPQSTPRIVLVVGGLGISQTSTQEALRVLAPDVTLAFAPYGASLERWVQKARGDGHELLLQIPMEPFDYPDNDPGPQTLLTSATPEVNADRLMTLLAKLTNYVGVVNYMGARYTSDPTALGATLKELTGRGLMYVDDGSSSRSLGEAAARAAATPFARADVVIDEVPRDEAIRQRLTQLEQIARTKGVAVGFASALPVSLRNLEGWIANLQSRGLVLVPVSAVASRS